MTGGKNSRWTELLRQGPISLYMAGAFRSALVPLASVDKLFGRQGYTATQLAMSWRDRSKISHWRRRERGESPFLRLDPGPGELVRQCARSFVSQGKWEHLAVLTAVAPTLLVPREADGDELDASLYVMF